MPAAPEFTTAGHTAIQVRRGAELVQPVQESADGVIGAITTVAFHPDGRVLTMAEGWPSIHALRLWGVISE